MLSVSQALHSLILSLKKKTSTKSLVVLSKCWVLGIGLNHVFTFAIKGLGISGATQSHSLVRARLLGLSLSTTTSLLGGLRHVTQPL